MRVLTIVQVLVIIPENHRVRFFVENSPDDEIRSWIQDLLAGNGSPSSRGTYATKTMKNDLEAICSLYLEKLKTGRKVVEHPYEKMIRNPEDDLPMLIRIAIPLSDKSLFERVLAFKANSLPLDIYFEIGSAMKRLGLDWCCDGYECFWSLLVANF